MSFIERKRRARPITREQLLALPNLLTYGRIAVVPLVVLLMLGINDADPSSLRLNQFLGWVTTLVLTAAGISDIVDGYYARKYGATSSFGKFLDPLADKLIAFAILIMLIPLRRLAAWVVVILMTRDITITALCSLAVGEGLEISASEWGKRKTLMQNFAMGFLLIHYPFHEIQCHQVGMILIGMTLFISVGSGLHYIWTFFSEVLQKKRGS